MNDENIPVVEVTEDNFNREVIEASRRVPVIADFWAEWCGPCRTLGPLLEEIVRRNAGRVILAKVDVDSNPGLAARYQIQSIPAVKIFKDGEVADEFVGALPEAELKERIETVLPSPSRSELEKANGLLSGGRWEEASRIYERVLKEEPASSPAHLGLGIIAYHQGRYEDAEEHLTGVDDSTPGYDQARPLLARIYFQNLPCLPMKEATEKLNENPNDPDALFSLAVLYARGDEYDRALDVLLQLLEIDRGYGDGKARAAFLTILDIVGRSTPTGRDYERKLSMVIFS